LVEHTLAKLISLVQFTVESHRKLEKTVLVACVASCSTLMGECQQMVYVWCCHWLATAVAFMVKAALWTMVQANGDRCLQTTCDILKSYGQKLNFG